MRASLDEIVPDEVRDALEHLGVPIPGAPDFCNIDRQCKNARPWPAILRRYVGQQRLVRRSMRFLSRRMPGSIGVIAGRWTERRYYSVLALIDTSGSVTTDLLNQIGDELRHLSRSSRVIVVECDTEIRRVYRFREFSSVVGRGGTDLRPPFTPMFIKKHQPDVIVYFPDGEGTAPPPKVPVIWCLTPMGEPPAPWGRVIRMGNEQK